MPVRVPKYRHHNASGLALVEIRGRHFYLGKFDSPESHEKYNRLIGGYLVQKNVSPLEPTLGAICIDQRILRYFKSAKTHYVRDGEPTVDVHHIGITQRRLPRLCGRVEVNQFGPKAYRKVQQSLIQEGLSHKYIYDQEAKNDNPGKSAYRDTVSCQ